ncbi:MAG: hypothetical protein ACFFED_07970 [Candidatus Thorarchaeota archaeon]
MTTKPPRLDSAIDLDFLIKIYMKKRDPTPNTILLKLSTWYNGMLT